MLFPQECLLPYNKNKKKITKKKKKKITCNLKLILYTGCPFLPLCRLLNFFLLWFFFPFLFRWKDEPRDFTSIKII